MLTPSAEAMAEFTWSSRYASWCSTANSSSSRALINCTVQTYTELCIT